MSDMQRLMERWRRAISEDDENDVIFGWLDQEADFPEEFYEEDGEDETEYFFFEKNLTNTGKV